MVVTSIDRMILHWAFKNGYSGDYRRVGGIEDVCLEVVLRHATVYFVDGRLVKMVRRVDDRHIDELVIEVAKVFALCAAIEERRDVERISSSTRGRSKGRFSRYARSA